MPMMAFIGVRISWLMFARNIDFACGGLFGRLLCPHEFHFQKLEVGDVLSDSIHVLWLAVLIFYDMPECMNPDNASVDGPFVGIGGVVGREFCLLPLPGNFRCRLRSSFVTQPNVFSPVLECVPEVRSRKVTENAHRTFG